MASRNKISRLSALLFFLGYVWLAIALIRGFDNDWTLCPIKNILGFPCPACGTTRSVGLILHGDFSHALTLNPFGFVVIIAMIIGPLWLFYDVAIQKNTYEIYYRKAESFINRRYIAIFLIILVMANWVWNIIKNV